MTRERLRIFVSGKEGELDDERAVAIEAIKEFHFDPVASEDRPASDKSIEDAYLGEVSDADIYIGIFGKTYSKPSRKEFDTARANTIPVLVFEKQLKDDKRDTELDEFLTEMKDPVSGITSGKYNNVVDFKEKFKEALSILISREFKKAKELEKQREMKRVEIQPAQTKYKVPFALEVGKASFVTFQLPDKINRGKPSAVSATVKGSTSKGFLDLLLVDPDGYDYWYPDPKSWNSVLDTGELCLHNESYSNTWEFTISDKSKAGKYGAIMGLYEDTADLPIRKRRLIALKEKEIEVV